MRRVASRARTGSQRLMGQDFTLLGPADTPGGQSLANPWPIPSESEHLHFSGAQWACSHDSLPSPTVPAYWRDDAVLQGRNCAVVMQLPGKVFSMAQSSTRLVVATSSLHILVYDIRK